MSDSLFYSTHASAIGELLLVASPRGFRYLGLSTYGEGTDARLTRLFGTQAPSISHLPGFFASSITAIDDYLAQGTPLSLPIDMQSGTALQRAVWFAIAKIPYGETISYGTLAERVGFPRAVRAVASACGANPVPLIIPCHRVLAKDGTLGGFSLGGLDVKERLLALEAPKQRVAA